MRLPTSPLQHLERSSLVNVTCQISPVSLLPLTKVVLSARTGKGYEFASRDPTLFRAWLCSKKPILRNGFTYRLMSPHYDSDVKGVFHEYTVIFSEPVEQGYALSNITEISVSLYHDTRVGRRISGKVEAAHEDEEYIEIDQNFMANSVLPSIGCVPHFNPLTPTYTNALFRLDPGVTQARIHAFRWHPQQGIPVERLHNTSEAFRSQQSWADQRGLGKSVLKRVDYRLIILEAILCAADTQARRLVKVTACQIFLPKCYVSLPVAGVDNVRSSQGRGCL